jgi:hypothetical protein
MPGAFLDVIKEKKTTTAKSSTSPYNIYRFLPH